MWNPLPASNNLCKDGELVCGTSPLLRAIEIRGGTLPEEISLVLSGHIHLWEALAVEGAPPQLVSGVGGTLLAPQIEPSLDRLSIGGKPVRPGGKVYHDWGFTLLTPDGEDWTATFVDINGVPRFSCVLGSRRVDC
jgi:hypothetical protein